MVAFLRLYDAISCLWGEHELDDADDCLGFRRLGYDGRRGPPRETSSGIAVKKMKGTLHWLSVSHTAVASSAPMLKVDDAPPRAQCRSRRAAPGQVARPDDSRAFTLQHVLKFHGNERLVLHNEEPFSLQA